MSRMSRETYGFELGGFACAAISDGAFNYPLEGLFANVPREQVEETLRQRNLPTDRVTTPYTCLFVDTGQHRVLVDTGAGNLAAVADQLFPSVDHSTTATGRLRGNLEAMGIESGSIDTVVISHAHPDHVGGTLDDSGKLVLPNARYFVARDEWEFWTSDAAAKAPPPMVNVARQNLEPLRGRLTLIDGGSEVVPGIRAIATPGHTPGHIALAIASEGALLLHISDVVLYPLHMEYPGWLPVFDMLPDQAASSKRRIFDRAAEERALVFAHHLPPFPSLEHVVKSGDGWRWQPIHEGP